jgi:chemotaxis protein MotB
MARRTRRGGDEHEAAGHERWLISYADFITLLFAFFVVMYAVSSVNEGRYRVLSDSLSSAFSGVKVEAINPGSMVPTTPHVLHRAPLAAPKMTGVQQAHMQDIAERLSKALATLVKDGQVRVTNTVRGVAVEINASVLFAPAQCDLQPQSLPTLRSIAQVLAGLDDLVQVEGHTDNLPIATSQFPSNWELSSARAGSVVRYFIDHDLSPARLSAAGYSEYHPVASNQTAEGRARNRRVTLQILPADPRPPSESGQSAQATEPSAGLVTAASSGARPITAGEPSSDRQMQQ